MSKRHKQLEETFNLPSLEDIDDDDLEDKDEDEDEQDLSEEELAEKLSSLQEQLAEYDKMGEISVKTTEKYNDDIDALYTTAKDGYTEIFNAALAMEPSQGAKFLNGAAKLLEIALKSKNSSMEKQLDMAKLQLEREKMYRNGKASSPKDIGDDDDYDTEDYGVGDNGDKIYDRNELIRKMQEKGKIENVEDDKKE